MHTITVDNTQDAKPFAWSYSKLKAFEDCPRRYNEVSIKKAWPEPESEQLKWGNDAHAAIATALRTGTLLGPKFHIFQKWVDKLTKADGELLIENDCQWAVTKDLKPTPWFAPNVWLRCIADAVKLNYPIALAVDWKAGKSANGDPIQLVLTSLMMFLQFPKLQMVRSDFVWLQEDRQTQQTLYRNECADQWAELMPRVERLEAATVNDHFPPQPGRFCKRWCPVRSCEYWGK